MRIGLYFGTFNPIHVGHLVIANYMADKTELDQVWMVVSPQNPLKNKASLLADYHRLELVRIGINDNPKLRESNIEFSLSKPSYTINTLAYLKEKYPHHEFALIMGEDNVRSLHKWKNYEQILANHKIFVYPRALTYQERNEKEILREPVIEHDSIKFCKDVPIMNISSSYIREAIKEGKDIRYLLTEPVFNYVQDMHFYK